MDRKDFFSGFHKGQAGIVKLASVQFFVVGAVQRVIIAGFRCLDIQVIAAFQTVGGPCEAIEADKAEAPKASIDDYKGVPLFRSRRYRTVHYFVLRVNRIYVLA